MDVRLSGPSEIVGEVNDHIQMVYYPPVEQRSNGVLMTKGLSTFEMPVPDGVNASKRCELAMVFPSYWPEDFYSSENENYNWPCKWLKRMAVVPEKNNTWLAEGHSFPADQLAPITEQEAFILIEPKVVKELSTSQEQGQILAVAPLTKKELNYKLKHGAPKFLKKFYTQCSEIIDLQRPPLKLKKFGLW